MATKDKSVFLTDEGEEISVRTVAQHTPTAITMLEPLYATDAESMDGIVGELRGKAGKLLRGTLRRQGNAFALFPEQPQQEVLEKTETKSPVASPPPPAAKVKEPIPETSPTQTAAKEAPEPVAPVLPSERTQVLNKTETTSPVASQPARRAKPKEKPPATTTPVSPPPRPVKPQARAAETPPFPSPPQVRGEPSAQKPERAPSQAEAMEALKTVAQFLSVDRSQVVEKTAPVISSQSPPSQGEAIEAERTVAQFLRGDQSVDLELAKQAHAIVSDFIAELERQMTARDA